MNRVLMNWSRILLLGATALVLPTAQVAAQAATEKRAPASFNRFASLSGSYLAGRMAMNLRDPDAASTYLQTTLAFDPGNQVIIDRTFPLLVAAGRFSEAIALSDPILARDKGNQFVRLVLAADALKKGHPAQARQQIQAMKVRPLTDLTGGIIVAWTQAAQGDTEAALKTIDKINGPDWYAGFKLFHSGMIADQAGRKADAVKYLKQAYGADPAIMRLADAYARALARSGDKDGALKIYADYEKVIPDQPMMQASRAEIASGKPVSPLIASAADGAAELLYGLGAVIGRDGGEEMAAIYLQLALMLQPKSELALISLGTLYGKLRDFDRAVDVLERVDDASPMARIVRLQIGRYYNLQGKPDEARSHIQSVVAKDPNDVDAALALADVLRNEKKYADAAAAYTRAIDLIGTPKKTDWSLFYYRGMSYERAKQWAKAEPDFLKALELDPNQADVLNYLGYSWIDMGMNLDRGLAMVKQAVELQPQNGFIIDSLGWAYYRLGRYPEAVETLEKAVSLRPEDPALNDHLGDAYWHVDRRLEARFQWNHARDLKPDPEDLPRILGKIADGLKEANAPTAQQVDMSPPAPKP